MSKNALIKTLSSSDLFAVCPKCRDEFELSKAFLFDGLEPFPEEALIRKGELENDFQKRVILLEKRTISADEGAERRALAVGLGKILEKIIPAHRDFNIPLSDCRPLFEPIDMIAFEGLSRGSIDSITFYEIKTGRAGLNKHERMIRDAVNDGKVVYRGIRMSENLIEVFQDFRTILCVCPCCGDLVRVSDLHLTFKGRAPRTWLDDFEIQLLEFDERMAKFLEEEDKIRKAAIERGRQQVVETACECIDERIARLNYDPYDIKALFHPVDFVVFNGMNEGKEVEDIVFLSRIEIEDEIRRSLKSAIEDNNYSWSVPRVTAEGNVEFE